MPYETSRRMLEIMWPTWPFGTFDITDDSINDLNLLKKKNG